MKNKYLLSLFLLMIISSNLFAQMYVQGDISVMPAMSAFHDSTQCASFATEMYSATVQNSFLGDSVIVKDQNTGMVLTSVVNSTGQNPWSVSLFPNSMMPVIPDNLIMSNMAVFGGSTLKFINGTDTIFNVSSFYQLPVYNPCEYANVGGRVYIDNNNDCNFNTADVAMQSINVSIADNTTNGMQSNYGNTNLTGLYSTSIQKSWMTNYVVSLPSQYQFIFPSTTCSPASYTYTTLPQTAADFSLQCTSILDVQSNASHPITARPNIPFIVSPYTTNTGCSMGSGIMKFVKDPHTVYNAALSTNPATSVIGDTLFWNYTNLTNLTNGAYWNSFLSGIHITPDNTVAIGDTLHFSVSSTVQSNDVDASNNQYSFSMPVVNSYDPNTKEVLPIGTGTSGNIPPSTPSLDYTIHFQNTGNAAAYTVSIIDTLDGDLLPNTLKIIGTSHQMDPSWLAPNVVKFTFSNIMLPDSNTNEAKSHGAVKFSVKLKSGLALGTQIKNKGYIYFDANSPIITNTTFNTIANPAAINTIGNSNSFTIYPNPANDYLTIEIPNFIFGENEMNIYSINSKLVKTIKLSKATSIIDIKNLNAGIYIIQVKSKTGVNQLKFIKE